MSEFSFEVIKQARGLIIRSKGYLTKEAGNALETQVKKSVREQNNRVLFDFSESPVINSSGMAKLLACIEYIFEQNEGKVAVFGLSLLTKTAFRTAGILLLVQEVSSEEERILFFQNP